MTRVQVSLWWDGTTGKIDIRLSNGGLITSAVTIAAIWGNGNKWTPAALVFDYGNVSVYVGQSRTAPAGSWGVQKLTNEAPRVVLPMLLCCYVRKAHAPHSKVDKFQQAEREATSRQSDFGHRLFSALQSSSGRHESWYVTQNVTEHFTFRFESTQNSPSLFWVWSWNCNTARICNGTWGFYKRNVRTLTWSVEQGFAFL